MKVLHLNAGNETGGGMVHILSLLKELTKEKDQFILGLLEKELFYDKAIQAGIRTVLFEQSSRYDFTILFKIIRFIKEEKVDILHTHGPRANLYGYFIRKWTNVTWMTTIHSDPRNDFLGRGLAGKLFTNLNLRVLKKPDHYFAITKRFTDMMEEFGVDSEMISTIYNGIDFLDTAAKHPPVQRSELNLGEKDFVIIMVARFDPVKRHDLAIEAMDLLTKTVPYAKLLLVGDGPVKKEIQEMAAEKGLGNQIRFLGFREDINALFALADVTLLTSKTESFPLVLLESAREKTPAVTTDAGGVRDMIPDPSYGFVLDDAEAKTIAEALADAEQLKRSNKLRMIGENFYHYSSRNFSLEAFVKSVYVVYKMYK